MAMVYCMPWVHCMYIVGIKPHPELTIHSGGGYYLINIHEIHEMSHRNMRLVN